MRELDKIYNGSGKKKIYLRFEHEIISLAENC